MRYGRNHTPRNRNAGFTLVELIVSVGLFTIVVTIAMSAYLRLISLDRKTRALNDVVTNLSFVVESMSRSIRTGTLYNIDDSNLSAAGYGSGLPKFSFTNDQGKVVTYILVATPNSKHAIAECVAVSSVSCTDGSGNETIITDPRIDVTNLAFWTNGISTATGGCSLPSASCPGADGKQPIMYFTIRGSIKPDPVTPPTVFTIESTATERLLEI